MKQLLAIAAFALAALPAAAQQDFSKVEIKTTKLTGSTYMLTGAGGNIGLSVGEDAVFVIDDQFAPLTPKITAAIAAITPKPVKFVLNTHWHFDHTGGNENLGKAGAIIVAHDNVRKRMSTEQVIEFINMRTKPDPKVALPVLTFSADMSFHLNGEELRAIHMPNAHTDGDAVVHFTGSDVIHMGDIYFNGFYPFIDFESGGSPDGIVAACDKVLKIVTDKTRIIPGHGPLSNAAELKAYRDMVATVSGRVKALVSQGKTLDDIKAAKVSADYDEKWGKGFIKPERFAEMLARALAKR
ncbi:MAG TPA: MBL fold metallo-hydrolase [Usitatibacter sp.]|nr:MBL fold metallo-hydrolase [Usitatibacter sp.]